MNSNFYRAFEDQHRGPRELIKSRLSAYLSFIEPLKSIHVDVNAVDLGCGRGEWLELLLEVGVQAYGVDLDQGMLSACRELGLSVKTSDAVIHLKTLANDSQSVVSAFHLVEHISFEQLQALVFQAHRVLKPGGLLIMETPNPENIVVATRNFYLDPTHQRPIPPELLSFVAHFYGFSRVKLVRLQESKDLEWLANLTLQDVLGGASPDYAVVAQKAAAHDLFAQLDAPFSAEYGLSLENLTALYQGQIAARIDRADSAVQLAEKTAQQAGANAQQAQTASLQAQARAEEARVAVQQAASTTAQAVDAAQQAATAAQQATTAAQQALETVQQAEGKAQAAQTAAQSAEASAQHAHQLLRDVTNSRSWRVTAPMRWGVRQLRAWRERGPTAQSKTVIKAIAKPIVVICFAFVAERPLLKSWMAKLARRTGLYAPLQRIHGRLTGRQIVASSPSEFNRPSSESKKHATLTAGERKIFADIQASIKANKANKTGKRIG